MQNVTGDDWAIIARILFVCLLALAIYTYTLYRRMPKYHTPLIGHEAMVVAWHGRDRRVEVFGAIWQAQLPDSHSAVLQTGQIVRVLAVHNLVLTVHPVGDI